MKFRSALLLAMAFAILSGTSSCVKTYTCHCDIKYAGYPGLPDSTFVEYDVKGSKSDAASKCKGESANASNNNITLAENCVIY